jgi:hypothetical protein
MGAERGRNDLKKESLAPFRSMLTKRNHGVEIHNFIPVPEALLVKVVTV